jgi:hypothetical protein
MPFQVGVDSRRKVMLDEIRQEPYEIVTAALWSHAF